MELALLKRHKERFGLPPGNEEGEHKYDNDGEETSTSSSMVEMRAAFRSFANVLHEYYHENNQLYIDGGAASSSATTTTTTTTNKKEEDEGGAIEGTPRWLLNECIKLPCSEIMGGPLQLAIQIVSACSKYSGSGDNNNNSSNEEGSAALQAELFNLLGEDEYSMNLLFQIVPLASDICDRVTLDALGKCNDKMNGTVTTTTMTTTGSSAFSSSSSSRSAIPMTKEEEESKRRKRLRKEAIEALNEAAIAKAQMNGGDPGVGFGVGVVESGRETHSVNRTSDKERYKHVKRLTKRAAAAVAAAKDAGVILDDVLGDDGEEGGYDYATLRSEANMLDWKRGLAGMNEEDLNEMKRHLLPVNSRMYHEQSNLPKGTEREWGDGYEKVIIPPPKRDELKLPSRITLRDVMNTQMCQAFDGTTSLNPMQSTVFNMAFHTQENLLICAPTGAGKTNVAMLTVVAHFRDVGIFYNENDPYAAYQNIPSERGGGGEAAAAGGQFGIGKKVIYIAPMKALAQEVVEKFHSKLHKLKIVVRELTGDMQLTRSEAESSDIIVTTPEKWDVVTRKGGTDGSLGASSGLLIIDEVHLLADDRGAVIESVVARLHRYIESSQRSVRLVGLSATLPNYKDVAKFLRVDEKRGLFHFGSEYRPVPLEQTFIGVSPENKSRFEKERKMNEVCYDVVAQSLKRGHQVMVFVHSRKGTGATATALADLASKKNQLESLFVTSGTEKYNEAYTKYVERVNKSRNRELSQHFTNGMGIHHAGMLRPDRKLTEQMFADGAIRVLCCTATLAWGINLPAHTVVIKGTEVYNPEKGGNVDLSILDVMQIFGRAGRPQFDTFGEATLITSHDGLSRYLDRLIRSVPIESNFTKQLIDHLNAEIVSGTVSNINEASEWLTYTYFYVRMCSNPLAYGISYDQKEDDPTLRSKCTELVRAKAKELDELRMIRYHEESGNVAAVDWGRVASHYYIQAETICTFREMLERNENPSDADLCHLICCANEFTNVKVRPEELDEVDTLKKEWCPLEVKIPVEEYSGKSCVLLQSYISNARNISSFTLISDTNYIASNAGRVARALFEMCLRRGDVRSALKLLRLAKSVDRRVWWFQTPLRQFGSGKEIPKNVFDAIESRGALGSGGRGASKQRKGGSGSGSGGFGGAYTPSNMGYSNALDSALALLEMHPKEVGQLCHWYRGGSTIQKLVSSLPVLDISCDVKPVTRSILRFHVVLTPKFHWNGKYHGGAEGFWIWVEDYEHRRTYHHEYVVFSKRTHPKPYEMYMNIPAFDPLPPQYYIRIVSDSWVCCESVHTINFQHLLLPNRQVPYTDLLDLTPLPITALNHPKFESIYIQKFQTFNPIQTQLFHILYHTNQPVLLGAPTGSGKTIVAEIALMRLKRLRAKSKCVYIAPLKSLARERLKEWKKRFGAGASSGTHTGLNWNVLELTGETYHDSHTLNRADVLICTPEKWDLITRGWRGGLLDKEEEEEQNEQGASAKVILNSGRKFVRDVGLLIIDEIHLLGEERGSVLEAIVSRTRYISRQVAAERRTQQQQQEEQEGSRKEKDDDADADDDETTTRIMGLSTALANPKDLADWMGIDIYNNQNYHLGTKSTSSTTITTTMLKPSSNTSGKSRNKTNTKTTAAVNNNIKGLYNFRPSVRPIPMETHIQGYAGRHYCPRMATMNKPCYAAIKQHSPSQPVIIFVASRRQTRLTALDLISYAVGDYETPHAFLSPNCDDEYINAVAQSLTDASLRHTLPFGVGLHHAGLSSSDRSTVEELFLNQQIQVLVATATLAWGVNLPAHLVIVKGTEYYDGLTHRYVDYPVTDVLQMMGRAGRPQFDTKGIAVIMVEESKKNFYKKFLYEPFPVESCLLKYKCEETMNAEIACGTIKCVNDGIGYLSWTYLARRVKQNPSYYGAKSGVDEDVDAFFLNVVHNIILKLERVGCVVVVRRCRDGVGGQDGDIIVWDGGAKSGDGEENWMVQSTPLGRASSNFYLNHRTPLQMKLGAGEVRNILSSSKSSVNNGDADDNDGIVRDGKPVGSTGANNTGNSKPLHFPLNLEVESIYKILLTLCWTHEFDELPVRHNEEQLNHSLSSSLAWPTGIKEALMHIYKTRAAKAAAEAAAAAAAEEEDEENEAEAEAKGSTTRKAEVSHSTTPQHQHIVYNEMDMMGDPHTKCFLLVLAYLSKSKLPISDYINDTKSVFDQLPRLLAAMCYIAAAKEVGGGIGGTAPGSLDLICMLAKTRQVLNTRMNVKFMDPLNQIPGIVIENDVVVYKNKKNQNSNNTNNNSNSKRRMDSKKKQEQKQQKQQNQDKSSSSSASSSKLLPTLLELCAMDNHATLKNALNDLLLYQDEVDRKARMHHRENQENKGGGGGGGMVEKAMRFLSNIPVINIDEPSVTFHATKGTGRSIGTLKFNFILTVGSGGDSGVGGRNKQKGAGAGDSGDVNFITKNMEEGWNFTLALGTPVGRFLLVQRSVYLTRSHHHASVSVDTDGGGGADMKKKKDTKDNKRRQHKIVIQKEMEMKFHWDMANSGGGSDGGKIILCILSDDFRGLDKEFILPLR